MKILDITYDDVISSHILICKSSLLEAKYKMVKLINKYEQQRYTLNSKLYNRLRNDIAKGCIIPPLTISFIVKDIQEFSKLDDEKKELYINDNLEKAFVLDGIQRLNNIDKIDNIEKIDDKPIYVNIIISSSYDKLLYRMITLNNGQKPMSSRHQIEMLCSNIINFDNIPLQIQTEKSQKTDGKNNESLTKENIVKAYLAFITNSINIDNQKIIDDKMDELISEKIMESNLLSRQNDFNSFIQFVNNLTSDKDLLKWISNLNNMIGFASAGDKIIEMREYDLGVISKVITNVDNIFTKYINTSKIKVSTYRRKVARYIGMNFKRILEMTENEILDCISDLD